jgi:hypothetical protein
VIELSFGNLRTFRTPAGIFITVDLYVDGEFVETATATLPDDPDDGMLLAA